MFWKVSFENVSNNDLHFEIIYVQIVIIVMMIFYHNNHNNQKRNSIFLFIKLFKINLFFTTKKDSYTRFEYIAN